MVLAAKLRWVIPKDLHPLSPLPPLGPMEKGLILDLDFACDSSSSFREKCVVLDSNDRFFFLSSESVLCNMRAVKKKFSRTSAKKNELLNILIFTSMKL